jgi:hypothetical protein
MRTMHTFAVTITADIKKVLDANPKRVCFRIFNNGTQTAFVTSNPSAAKADCYPILTQTEYKNRWHQGEVYMISDAGDRNMRIEEDTE